MVEEIVMNGVEVSFVALQVVAFLKSLGNVPMSVRNGEKLIIGKEWCLLWTQVSENDSTPFLTQIRRMTDCRPLLRPSSEPSVINASQPPIFYPAITQVCSPVRTMDAQQSGSSFVIPKQYQILSQQTHGHRSPTLDQFLRQSSRLPIPAHKVPAWRTRIR
jgi:hypothetical protein